MNLKIQHSSKGFSHYIRDTINAFSFNADAGFEFIDFSFKIGGLDDPDAMRNYDLPNVRYSDGCIGPLLRSLDRPEFCHNPAIYVFKLTDVPVPIDFNPVQLKSLRDALAGSGIKMSPVKKQSQIKSGSLLYVGMRQPDMITGKKLSLVCSRIIAHFGYGKATQSGLQLAHWKRDFPDLAVDLRIHLLPHSSTEFVVMYEKMYALQNPPILGQHK